MGRVSTQRIEEWINDYDRGFMKDGSLTMDMTDYIGDPIVKEYMKGGGLRYWKQEKDV